MKIKFLPQMNRRGFSLIEMVTVLAVVGTLVGVIYSVFITNGQNFQDQITRADLLQEANLIFEQMTDDARAAKRFDINTGTTDGGDQQKSVAIIDFDDNEVRYVITELSADRTIIERQPIGDDPDNLPPAQLLSDQVVIDTSDFVADGNSLTINLALASNTFHRQVQVLASTEIYSRN